MTRFAIITNESVWLATQDEPASPTDQPRMHVVARASFGFRMPREHDYSGWVLDGYGEQEPKVGNRIRFQCGCGGDHAGWGDNTVTTGVIQRIVRLDDAPPAMAPDGHISIRPSWNWLMPFVAAGAVEDARHAFNNADTLAELVAMGRVTSEDIHAARERIASA